MLQALKFAAATIAFCGAFVMCASVVAFAWIIPVAATVITVSAIGLLVSLPAW